MTTRVLLVTPTYAPKGYAMERWLSGILGLEIPKDTEVTVLALVNTDIPGDHSYFDVVNDRFRDLGPNFWATNIEFRPEVPLDYRIATLYNLAAQVVLDQQFDFMFIVEADVELSPGDLKQLLRTSKLHGHHAVVSGVTCYADKTKDDPKTNASGVMVFAEMPEEDDVLVPASHALDIVRGGTEMDVLHLRFPCPDVIPAFPPHRPYTIAEARKKQGTYSREASVSFGCMLIPHRVLWSVRFRCGVLSTVFPDFLFCSDLKEVIVDWDVWPKHHPHEWFTAGIRIGMRPDVVSAGRLWWRDDD